MPHRVIDNNSHDVFKSTRRGLIAPVVTVFVISVAIMAGLSIFSVRSLDRVSAEKSLHLTRSIFHDIERSVRDLSYEYAYWDQAVENMVVDVDPDWGDENIGTYLNEVYDVSASIVIGEADDVVYASIDGERIAPSSVAKVASSLAPLIARVRSETVHDAPPEPISGYMRTGNHMFFASAAVLTTYGSVDGEEVDISTNAVLILMKQINDELLESLTERYLLSDLRLDRSFHPDLTPTSLLIKGVNGAPIGALHWRADAPGSDVMTWLLPAVAALFLAMAGLVVLAVRRATKASQDYVGAVAGRHEAELEQQLGKIQKTQALGIMVGGVAHNFNNLLQPIMMLAMTMRKRADENSRDWADLTVIIQACEKAADLVKEIADYTRDKEMGARLAYDAFEAVHQGCRLVATTIPSSITMIENLDENVGAVKVDAVELQSVLMNLISNAIDAMEGQVGELTISLSRVIIDEHTDGVPLNMPKGTYVKLAVSDTGIGMDKATMERIYDPFFTTKGVGGGTGLGLSSAYGIIARNGGFVSATSSLHEGTTFDVYLPLAEGEQHE